MIGVPPAPVRKGVGGSDAHRMNRAVEFAAPEGEEAAQFGIVRGKIVILPDEGLEKDGVIRQAIEDLGGGQPPFS